jgi:hypothetical protein
MDLFSYSIIIAYFQEQRQKSGKGKGLDLAEFIEVLARLGVFIFGNNKAPDGKARSDVDSVMALQTLLYQAAQSPRHNSSLRDLHPLAVAMGSLPVINRVAQATASTSPEPESTPEATSALLANTDIESLYGPELAALVGNPMHAKLLSLIFVKYASKIPALMDQYELIGTLKDFSICPLWISREDVTALMQSV